MKYLLLVLVLVTAVTTTAEGATDCQGADIDGNGKVDFTDFTILAAKFGTTDCDTPACAALLVRIEALERRNDDEQQGANQGVMVLSAIVKEYRAAVKVLEDRIRELEKNAHRHLPTPSRPEPQPVANACQHLKEVIVYLSESSRYQFAPDTLAAKIGQQVLIKIQQQVNREFDLNVRRPDKARVFAIADSVLQCNAGPYACVWLDDVVSAYSGPWLSDSLLDDTIGESLNTQIREALLAAFPLEQGFPTSEQVEPVVKRIMGCQ